MCPYYPAKEGLTRLTAAEVTERASERKRGLSSSRDERQNDNSLSRNRKHPEHAQTGAESSRSHLYTTCVCVLRLHRLALLIYGTLQVPWRRCRALQFMSNLVNILSPVTPVSHCFSPLSSVLPSPADTPRSSADPPIPSDSCPFVVCGRRCESLTSELWAR